MTIIARRVIRSPVPPNTVELIPDQAMWVEGDLDYIDDGTADLPAHVIYLATMDETGAITETIDKVQPNNRVHTYAGWPIPDGHEL